jgi:hypothetical protein
MSLCLVLAIFSGCANSDKPEPPPYGTMIHQNPKVCSASMPRAIVESLIGDVTDMNELNFVSGAGPITSCTIARGHHQVLIIEVRVDGTEANEALLKEEAQRPGALLSENGVAAPLDDKGVSAFRITSPPYLIRVICPDVEPLVENLKKAQALADFVYNARRKSGLKPSQTPWLG